MAKVSVIIEDTVDENGEETVNLSLVFDPPVEKGQPHTMAQNVAGGLISYLGQNGEMEITEVGE